MKETQSRVPWKPIEETVLSTRIFTVQVQLYLMQLIELVKLELRVDHLIWPICNLDLIISTERSLTGMGLGDNGMRDSEHWNFQKCIQCKVEQRNWVIAGKGTGFKSRV